VPAAASSGRDRSRKSERDYGDVVVVVVVELELVVPGSVTTDGEVTTAGG